MSKTNAKVIYDAYNRPKVEGLKCDIKEGRTHQSFKDECNVNTIVEKYTKTGLWSNSLKPGTRVPMFGDFTNAPDFMACMDRIIEAQAEFDSLPSGLRKRFANDPAELLDFLNNPSNKDEAISLGLLKAAPGGAGDLSAAPSAESPKAKA